MSDALETLANWCDRNTNTLAPNAMGKDIIAVLSAAGLMIVDTATLKKLFRAKGDHMTACDKTMGDSHPCTCGANALRAMVEAARDE